MHDRTPPEPCESIPASPTLSPPMRSVLPTLRRPHLSTFLRACLACILCWVLSPSLASAQTYTPRTIHIEAPPTVDTANALRVLNLPSGAALTRQQIETALGRLADTGIFSEISYTVSSAALTIKLTPSSSSLLRSVHLANFVWWQPAQLESLLEATVPGYQGKLPLSGALADQVKATLVSLLKAKGIQATVAEVQSTTDPGIVNLSITNPSILVDEIILPGTPPELRQPIKQFTDTLYNSEFDSDKTVSTLHDNVLEIYRNGGYLDATVSAPLVSAPHSDLFNYAVDLTSTVQPGDLYHLSSIDVSALTPAEQQAFAIDVPTTPLTAADQALNAAIGQALGKIGIPHARVVSTVDRNHRTVALQVLLPPATDPSAPQPARP